MVLPEYKFCSVCGGGLFRKDKNLECSKCGEPRYINSAPTANGIIFNEKKELLLAQRGNEPARLSWDFPGGFLENGEEPVLGLKREIKEELGLDCKVGDFFDMKIGCFFDVYRECTLNMYFFVELGKGDPRPFDDVLDLRWWRNEEISLETMPYLGAFEIVEKLRREGYF